MVTMSRMATIPSAIAIERAVITNGVVGPAELVDPPAHADLSSVRMIYPRLSSSGLAPATCIEQTHVLWRFILTSDEHAQHWARELTKMAQVG